jgi:hypothetical protein
MGEAFDQTLSIVGASKSVVVYSWLSRQICTTGRLIWRVLFEVVLGSYIDAHEESRIVELVLIGSGINAAPRSAGFSRASARFNVGSVPKCRLI